MKIFVSLLGMIALCHATPGFDGYYSPMPRMFPRVFRPSGVIRRFPTFSGPFSSGVRVGLPLISPRVFTRRSPFMSSIDPYPTIRSYALRAPLESTFPYTASAPVMGPVSLEIPGYTSGFAPYTTSAPRLTGPIAAGVSRYTPGVGAFSPISRLNPTLGGVSSLGPALSFGVSSSLGSATSVGPLLSASGLSTSIGSTPRISPLISASGQGTSTGSAPISPLISVSSLPASPAVGAGTAGLETSYIMDTGRTPGVTLEPIGIIDERGRYRAFDRSDLGTTGLSVAIPGGRMASEGSLLNRNSELALGTTSIGLSTPFIGTVGGTGTIGTLGRVDGGAGIRYNEIRDASLITTAGSVASSSPLGINNNARNTIGDQYNLPATGGSSLNAGGVDFRSLNSGRVTGDSFRTGGIDSRNIGGFTAENRNFGGFAVNDRNTGAAGNLNSGRAVDLNSQRFAAGGLNSQGFAAGGLNSQGFAAGGLNSQGFAAGGLNSQGFAADNRNPRGFAVNDRNTGAVGNFNSGRAVDVGNLNSQGFAAGGPNSQGFTAGGLNSQGFAAGGHNSQGFAAGGLNSQGFSAGGLNSQGFAAGGRTSGGGGAVSLNSRQAAIGSLNTGSPLMSGGVEVVGLNARAAGMSSIPLTGAYNSVGMNRAGLGDVRVQDGSFAGNTNAGTFGGNLRDTAFMSGVGADTSGLASNLNTRMDPAGPARTGSLGSTVISSSDPTYVTDVNTAGSFSGATGGEIGGSASSSGPQSVGQGFVDVGGFQDPAQAGGLAVDVRVAGGTGAEIGPGFALGPGGFEGKSRNSGPLSQNLGAATLGTQPNIINGGPPGRSVFPAESTPV